jgi:hypothetical protein
MPDAEGQESSPAATNWQLHPILSSALSAYVNLRTQGQGVPYGFGPWENAMIMHAAYALIRFDFLARDINRPIDAVTQQFFTMGGGYYPVVASPPEDEDIEGVGQNEGAEHDEVN